MKRYSPDEIEDMRDNLAERFMNLFWEQGLQGEDAEDLAAEEVNSLSPFMIIQLYEALGKYEV